MAQKTIAQPATKNKSELGSELLKQQTELAEAKRSHAARELANTHRLKELRQSIARTKTAITRLKHQEENA